MTTPIQETTNTNPATRTTASGGTTVNNPPVNVEPREISDRFESNRRTITIDGEKYYLQPGIGQIYTDRIQKTYRELYKGHLERGINSEIARKNTHEYLKERIDSFTPEVERWFDDAHSSSQSTYINNLPSGRTEKLVAHIKQSGFLYEDTLRRYELKKQVAEDLKAIKPHDPRYLSWEKRFPQKKADEVEKKPSGFQQKVEKHEKYELKSAEDRLCIIDEDGNVYSLPKELKKTYFENSNGERKITDDQIEDIIKNGIDLRTVEVKDKYFNQEEAIKKATLLKEEDYRLEESNGMKASYKILKGKDEVYIIDKFGKAYKAKKGIKYQLLTDEQLETIINRGIPKNMPRKYREIDINNAIEIKSIGNG